MNAREPFVYIEAARVGVEDGVLVVHQDNGCTQIPVGAVAAILLGPGCTITSAAVKACSTSGATIVHVGQQGVRFVGFGKPWGATSGVAEVHARRWVVDRTEIAAELFRRRWNFAPTAGTLDGIRGEEGAQMKRLYPKLASDHKIRWDGRRSDALGGNDAVNSALSWAGACLNAASVAAVHAAGAVPALGFLHAGGAHSFAYDIADLHRNTIISIAFDVASTSNPTERHIRSACRDWLRAEQIIPTMIHQITTLLTPT